MPRTNRTSTQRGYGSQHQAERRRLLPHAYGTPCIHCGQPMQPNQPLDLDHTPDRTAYRGIVHATCNRRDGARRGNAQRGTRQRERDQPHTPERDW